MGIFDKLFGALKKTKEGWATKLRMLFSKNKLGDEFYEELEEILIASDVSVSTATEVVERVKERAIKEKLKDGDYVVSILKDVLVDILEESEVEEPSYPCVIMLVGVNGVGKTTTVGKLAHYFLKKGKTVTVAAADTFRAAASYGKQLCDLIVSVNGKEITPNGSRYDLLLAVGENHILLTAKHGNITKEWSYTVRYVNSVPNISVGLADGQICRGSVYNFDVVAKDGLGKKLSASQISFSIDWNAEDGADSYVDVTGISKIWDDDTMTSFRIGFGNSAFSSHAGTPFRLKITATDTFGKTSEVVRTMTYVPAAPGEKIGEVVFSMEGFSIGCGYFIEPIRIPVYAGVPFAKALTDMLTDRGLTYTYTGEIEKGFYLSSVTGLDLTGNRIADGIWDFVKDRGYLRSIPAGASLGEFDFGSGSGWMYSVNGVYKNYGFSDYYPQDGDTVRVQFTVILGEDLGGGGALGGGHGNSLLGDDPDYAPIMKLLAEIANDPSVDKTVYREVIAAVSEWNLSQKAMDEQIQKLKTAYGTKE